MIHLRGITDNLQMMEKIEFYLKQFEIQGKNTNKKLTTTQTDAIQEKKKAIDHYAHSEQKIDHSETIDIFRNRQIYRETELFTIYFCGFWFASSFLINPSCFYNF